MRHRQARRLEVLKFSAGALLLVAAFGAVTVLQQPGARLLQQLTG
jgi:hypothetical protein